MEAFASAHHLTKRGGLGT